LGLAVATVGVVTALPAEAAVPNRFGFVLYNGGAVVGSGTTPAATTVLNGSPGRYLIRFPGQGTKGGVIHVTAINPKPHWCQIDKFAPSGADELVAISCYKPGGVRQNSAFSLIFSSSSGPAAGPGRFGYVDSQPSGAIVSQYNSAGLANGVSHPAVGRWLVKLPGLGTPGPQDGSLQATAVSPNVGARCKVANWASSPAGQQVKVFCFNSAGAPFDTRFHLSFQYRRALYGAVFPPKNFGYLWNRPPLGPPSTNFNSVLGPGVNAITPAGVGLSLVTFKAIGVLPDDVQVTAFGAGSQFCGLLTAWAHSGSTVIVRDVNCFTNAGTPVNTGFFVSHSSRL
jgi:hypothetical protein